MAKVNTNLMMVFTFIYKICQLLVGGFITWLGYTLFIKGITGQVSIVVDTKGLNGQLINASPGVFLAIGGIIIIVMSIRKGLDIDYKNL